MDIRDVAPGFAVAPQLAPSALCKLAQRGFTGLIPVSGGVFPDAAIAAFRAVRRGSEGPVLAYCRTGTRSITLETLANADDIEPFERLKRAAAAGYDLTGLSEQLS